MAVLRYLFGEHAPVAREREFQLLLLASVMAPLGTSLLSPLLDSLTGVYRVSPARIGLLMSALTAPGIVCIPIAGSLADRYGRKPVLVGSLLLFGFAGTGLAASSEFRVAVVLRVLQGIGFAGIVPTLIASLGDIYDGTTETTAQGLRIMAVGGSLVVFPPLAGILVGRDWRLPFVIYGCAIPIALLLLIRLDEPMDSGVSQGNQVDDETSGPGIRGLVTVATQRSVAPLLIARGLPTFVWIGFLTYNSIIVVRLLDGTPEVAGVLVAAGSGAFALAASQSGRLTTRAGGREIPLLAGHGALFVGVTLLVLAWSLPIAAVGVVVAGSGFGLTTTLYRSVVSILSPEPVRGGLVSLTEVSGRVSATLSPVVIGVFVGVATPIVGFDLAVRGTLLGVCGICTLLGTGCLIIARVDRSHSNNELLG